MEYFREYDLKIKNVIKAPEVGKKNGYYEIPYKEYREDGTPHETGTEEFSSERYMQLVTRSVYVKTGATDKGGRSKWTEVDRITSTSVRAVRKICDMRHKNAQLREY